MPVIQRPILRWIIIALLAAGALTGAGFAVYYVL